MISSRTLLLSLVGLNLLALLWWTGQLGPLLGSPLEPQRLSRQIQADALRVVMPGPRAVAAPVVAGMRETAPVSGRVLATLPDGPDRRADERTPEPASVEASTRPEQPDGLPVQARSAAGGVPGLMPDASLEGARMVDPAVPSSQPESNEASLPQRVPDMAMARRADDAGADLVAGSERSASAPALDASSSASDVPVSPLPGATTDGEAGSGPRSPDVPDLAIVGSGDSVSCLQVEGLSYPEYQDQARQLRNAGMTVSGERISSGRYVVYVGPLASADLADARAQALGALGVNDTHVMRSGALRNAISVGLLSSRDLALQHRDALARRGVKDLQIAPFSPLGSRYRLQASGPSVQLTEMARFLGSGVRLQSGVCP